MIRFLWLLLLALGFGQAEAATVNASSCSEGDVNTAIGTANAGDTVAVPAGSCTWSSLSIAKAVDIIGAGIGVTNITLGAGNSVTKQTGGVTRIKAFSFSKSGGGNSSKGWTLSGPWPSGQPIVFDGNEFDISGTGLFIISTPGGVVIANNDFTGAWDDSFIQPKYQGDTNSWTTADTLGDRDTDGRSNIYVEDNTFYGGTNQGIDCDEQSRCVYRYNDLTYSSFNTHGYATSPSSVRHFEVYNNNFIHNGSTEQIGNQNWAIWIRGGTGFFYNNDIDDMAGGFWGDKAELKFTIRGAESPLVEGSCGNTSYPVEQQLGQNHNGTSYFTDPIRIYNNTGGGQAINAGWNYGNPCGFTWTDFYQSGRDYIIDGGAKPGYTAYTYPHPALASGPTPTATINANPTTVAYPGSTDLTWSSTDATSCTGTNFSTGGATSGGPVSDSPVSTLTYEVDCTGPGGSANDTVLVTVTGSPTAPTASLTADPTTIDSGDSSDLSWTSTDATSCTGTGFSTGGATSGGPVSVSPTVTTVYEVDCTGAGGDVNDTAQVTVSGANYPALPEGDNGIAAGYPSDTNIGTDLAVLFVDDFESYTVTADLSANWDNFYQSGNIAIDTGTFYGGSKAVRLRMPSTGSEVSNAIVKTLTPDRDEIYIRVMERYQAGYAGVNSAHNGTRVTADYPGPGQGPSTAFAFVGIESSQYQGETQPGYINAYVYHSEQNDAYGEHWYPSGLTSNGDGPDGGFGGEFVSRSNQVPILDQWVSLEIYIKLNTVGQSDGRIAFWKDGVLAADWHNVRWRVADTVKLDEIQLENGGQGSSQQNDKWYDNVVVATEYIGPVFTGADTTAPGPVLNLQIEQVAP